MPWWFGRDSRRRAGTHAARRGRRGFAERGRRLLHAARGRPEQRTTIALPRAGRTQPRTTLAAALRRGVRRRPRRGRGGAGHPAVLRCRRGATSASRVGGARRRLRRIQCVDGGTLATLDAFARERGDAPHRGAGGDGRAGRSERAMHERVGAAAAGSDLAALLVGGDVRGRPRRGARRAGRRRPTRLVRFDRNGDAVALAARETRVPAILYYSRVAHVPDGGSRRGSARCRRISVRVVGASSAGGSLGSRDGARGRSSRFPSHAAGRAGDDIVADSSRTRSPESRGRGDVVAVSETAVAIAQGRAIARGTIRARASSPTRCRAAPARSRPSTSPNRCNWSSTRSARGACLVRARLHVVGPRVGRRGVFYELLGEAIAAIDGYTGTLPPYERAIVLGPEDPDRRRRRDRAALGRARRDRRRQRSLHRAKTLGASRGVNVARRRARAAQQPARQRRRADADRRPRVARRGRASARGCRVSSRLVTHSASSASSPSTLVLAPPLIRALRRRPLRQTAYEDAPQTHAGRRPGPRRWAACCSWSAPLVALAVRHDALTLGARVLGRSVRRRSASLDDVLGDPQRAATAGCAHARSSCSPRVAAAFLARAHARRRRSGCAAPILRSAALQLVAPHLAVARAGLCRRTRDDARRQSDRRARRPRSGHGAAAARRAGVARACRAGARRRDRRRRGRGARASVSWSINRHPAKMFMGDTGSLTLGAVLAGSAILIGNQLLLLLIGGVFAARRCP